MDKPSKLSRGSSSRWGRKPSAKRSQSVDAEALARPSTVSLPPPQSQSKGKERERELEQMDQLGALGLPSAASIVPDPLGELPSWYRSDVEWSAATAIQFRRRYPLHNPVGPRWYKNHHLVSPSHTQGGRPPTVFSPSFPPISVSPRDPPDQTVSLPAALRSPSRSPLPTPSSSQLNLTEHAPPRTRKVSQNAADADKLDVSDPWGINFHHHSPYDIGRGNGSTDPPEGHDARSRKASSIQQTFHRTITPSPLSQSTSALQLQPPEPEGAQIPRKLSKRSKPGVRNIFGGQSDPGKDALPKSTSAPNTPLEPSPPSMLAPPRPDLRKRLSRRSSIRPAAASTTSVHIALAPGPPSPEKKEKRVSILGRIARRLTIRKPRELLRVGEDKGEDWEEVSGNGSAPTPPARGESPEKQLGEGVKSPDMSRRIPPPTLEDGPMQPGPDGLDRLYAGLREQKAAREEVHRSSMSVVDAPYSIGKLTVANPDNPSSAEGSPVVGSIPLQPEYAPSSLAHAAYAGIEVGVISPMSTGTSPPIPPKSPRMENSLAMHTMLIASQPELSVPPKAEPPPTSPEHAHQHHRQSHSTSQAHPVLTSAHSDPIPSFHHQPVHETVYTPEFSVSQVPVSATQKFSALPWLSTGDSPMSTSSVLANPPTPHVLPEAIPHHATAAAMPGSVPAPVSAETHSYHPSGGPSPTKGGPSRARSGNSGRSTQTPAIREESPTKQGRASGSRSTETFRLVRSPSAGGIVANGEHWDVVESSGKQRSKGSKDRDRSNSKEKEKEREREREGSGSGGRKEGKREKRRSEQEPSSSSRKPVTAELYATNDEAVDNRRDRDHERDRRHRSDNRRSTEPEYLDPRDVQPGANLRRNASTSSRPTSELPSAAEINAFKAREAWERDRLFRGRSVYTPDGGPMITDSIYASPTSEHGPSPVNNGAIYAVPHNGSSHTSYAIQTPFQPYQQHGHGHGHGQGHGSASAAFFSVPPPTLYAAAPQPYGSQQPSQAHPRPSFNGATYNSAASVLSHRSYPDSVGAIPSEPGSPPRPVSNPLPPPPRQSSYQAPQLSPTREDARGPSSPDYWKARAGLTAAH